MKFENRGLVDVSETWFVSEDRGCQAMFFNKKFNSMERKSSFIVL